MSVRQFIDFTTVWALFLAIGGVLNLICTAEFRAAVGARIFGSPTYHPKATLKIGQIARLYIDNTILRFFGPNPLSIKALTRSVLLSIAFLALVLIGLCLLTGKEAISKLSDVIFNQGIFWVTLFFAIVLFLDWVSYLQTYLFMRFASVSRFFEIVFIAYADIVLSINIFLFIFPLALVTFLLGHFSQPFYSLYALQFWPLHSDQQRLDYLSLVERYRQLNPRSTSPGLLLDDSYNSLGSVGTVLIGSIYSGWDQAEFEKERSRPLARGSLLAGDYHLLGAFRYKGVLASEVAASVLEQLERSLQAVEFRSHDLTAALINGTDHADGSVIGLSGVFSPTIRLDMSDLGILYDMGFIVSQKIQADLPTVLWNSEYMTLTFNSPEVPNALIRLIAPNASTWLSYTSSSLR